MGCKNIEKVSLEVKLSILETLVKQLQAAKTIADKLEIVNSQEAVEGYLSLSSDIRTFLASLNPEFELMVKILLAIGQGPVLFHSIDQVENKFGVLKDLIDHLLEVEKFYAFMGGLAGYYCFVVKLLVEKKNGLAGESKKENFLRYPGIDLSQESIEKQQFIRISIENLPAVAAIFPVGGAGDRLDLRDEITGKELPAAYLNLGGFSLLEGIIRDFQAKEFLYWKFFGKQLTIPMAMMTSQEKDNDNQIASICEKNKYFGRPIDSLRRFIQPLVPVITEEGYFSQSAPLVLKLKPGGHGVLWKLAAKEGLFNWFEDLGCSKLLIRQINNPVAGTDEGILAFLGAGCKMNKAFGFASCERLVNASEGMVILREEQIATGYRYTTSNIEYTDFKSKGIQDIPKEPGSPYSAYPANTNILFVDLKTIASLVQQVAVPGMMINMKSKVPHVDKNGAVTEVYGGRLESMMQNISDSIVDEFPEKLTQRGIKEKLRCFVTYGERGKVISVTKNKYNPGKSLLETPEGCFYDQMANCRDLLVNFCGMEIPKMSSERDFMEQGPSFILRYHPALGPLYKIIAQKIQRGILKEGAELIFEIAELHCRGLSLDGSMSVVADNPLGTVDPTGLIRYSNQNGKCELMNVKVINRGVDRQAQNIYWKNKIARHERLEIILHGNAEFYAADVCFEGNMRIEVPSGTRMEVTQSNGKLEFNTRKITHPSWQWHYTFGADDVIVLKKSR